MSALNETAERERIQAILNLLPDCSCFAFSGRSLVSRFIKFDTCSKYSHIGGLLTISSENLAKVQAAGYVPHIRAAASEWKSRRLIIESTTICDDPCELLQARFSGVQAHEPVSRIMSYDGHVWAMPLRPQYILSTEQHERIASFALREIGNAYDHEGAFFSGTRLLKYLWPKNEDLSYAFCDELWLGLLKTIDLVDKSVNSRDFNPGNFVSYTMRTGIFGELIPIK